mgnify:CR=1 FL=1
MALALAIVLLSVLIIGSIAGTIWESSWDAKVARGTSAGSYASGATITGDDNDNVLIETAGDDVIDGTVSSRLDDAGRRLAG